MTSRREFLEGAAVGLVGASESAAAFGRASTPRPRSRARLPRSGRAADSIVWPYGEDGYVVFHVYGLGVTDRGTLLAFTEGRLGKEDFDPHDLLLKRSEDGGATWSRSIVIERADGRYWAARTPDPRDVADKRESWGNPATLVDRRTGWIFIFYALNEGALNGWNLQRRTRVFHRYSEDDGRTWSDRVDVTDVLNMKADGSPNLDAAGEPVRDADGLPCDFLGRAFHMPGPGHGIQLRSGRLLLQCWSRTAIGTYGRKELVPVAERRYGISTIYSDDGGATWLGGGAFGHEQMMNESRLVERSDGGVYCNGRKGPGGDVRVSAVSRDGGVTWSQPEVIEALGRSRDCDAGLIHLPAVGGGPGLLLFSKGSLGSERALMTVWASPDEGRSWPHSTPIHNGFCAYSDLAALPDGTAVLLYGANYLFGFAPHHVRCARFNVEWLLANTGWPPATG